MSNENVYAAPTADISGTTVRGTYPGFRRLPYFLASIGLQVVYLIGIAAFAASESVAALGAVVLVMLAGAIYIGIQRLKNIGDNPFWILGIIVPLLNLYVGVRMLAMPEGYADHKTMDTAAKWILGIFVGLFVVGIAAAVILPAVLGT